MQVIPGFRISEAAIEKDIALMQFYGAEIRLNTPAPSVAELNVAGYTHIFFAVGAGKAGRLNIPGNVVPVIQWLRDLKAGKKVSLGHVAVIGGGNTAMDAARAAIRSGGSVRDAGLPPHKTVYARRCRGIGTGNGRWRSFFRAGCSCCTGKRQAGNVSGDLGRIGWKRAAAARFRQASSWSSTAIR